MVNFTSSTTGSGNDNNIIENCNITNAGGNRPICAIFSSGSTGRENSGNIIRNNNIYDFFSAGATSYGIILSYNTTDWIISGNSFYDTETITPEGSFKYYPLFINTGTHTISNNYIGGSQPLCNGSAWTINSSKTHYFCGVFINGTITNASTVENNTIKNISYTSTEDNPWDGILINSGLINVTGNTIGATEGQGSVTITTPVASATTVISGGVVTDILINGGGMGYTTAPLITFSGGTTPAIATAIITGGVVTGITLISGGSGYTSPPRVIFDGQSTGYSTSHGMIQGSSATVNITGNNIGSITTAGSDTYSHGFESIYVRNVAGTLTISNNLIGSLVTPNSIITSTSGASSLQKQDCLGILSSGIGTTIISDNTIANLHNAYTGTLSASRVRGIQITAGSNVVQNNTVRNISSASGQNSFGSSASVIGISQTGIASGTTQTISGNSVYDLSNTNASATVFITGIYYAGPTPGDNTITGNFVHSLSLASPDINCEINGIALYRGLTTTANNIINLGGNTIGYKINGIRDESGSSNNNNIYFNSVYIGGEVSSGTTTSSTYALWNSANTSTRDYRNNILANARTGGLVGKHIAIRIAGIANTTIDYNDYYSASGTLGRIGSLDKADLAAWQASTGQDLHSLSINPGFAVAGGISALNYYTSAVLPGVSGTGITTDYAGLSRGAVPNMGALENNDYTWQGGTSNDFGTASNWTGGAVPPENADITFAVNPDRNCVLDINRSVGNITNSQAAYKLVVNGKQLTINGSLIFSNGAQIDASNTSSEVVFAGSGAQNIPSGAFVSNIIASLTVNNVNGLTLNGDITINEGIALKAGNFAIGPNTLTFNGVVTDMTGTVTGGSSTNMIIGGTGSIINMPAFLLNDLTINRVNGVSLYGNLSIAGTLTLTAGTLTVGSNTLTLSGSSPVRTSGLIDASNTSATAVFGNATAVTLPASIFAGAINNLSITNTGGVTAGGDFTINGILNLSASNPSAIKGLLDMGEYTLSMGANATTTGIGDVTGIVKRTSFVPNRVYTFGNPFTTVTFPNTGTLPTEWSIKLSTGTAPAWKTGAIQRTYDIIRTGGTGSLPTVKLHYIDTELNSNTEADLVFFGYLAGDMSVTEYGRVNSDQNDNWVSLTGSIEFAPTAFGVREWTLSDRELPGFTWLGAVPGQETEWNANMNWSGGSIPINTSDVFIPAGCAYYPTLPSSTTINSVSIENGATLNGGTATSLTINGGNGAWYNRGMFNPQTSTVIFTNAGATMSGRTDFYNITINAGAGVTLTTDNITRIAGSIDNSGSLDATEFPNTVEYNGENQTVINPNGATAGYYHLILSGNGTKTLPATAMSVLGDFTTSGSAIATVQAAMTIAGNITVGEGSTFVTGTYNHSIGGNFDNSGTFTATTGGTVTMNGFSAQSFLGTAATSFYNLTINNSQGVSVLNDVTADNVLTLISGNLIVGETTLGINGTISKTAGYIAISPLSSLSFGGADALTLPNDLFAAAPLLNNLTINRSGGVTLGNQNLTVNGVLNLLSGTLSLAANTLTIAGSSPTRTSGNIDAAHAAATLAFTNTNAIILPASVFSGAVNNLIINGTGGITAISDFTINGALNLQAVNPSAIKGSLDMLDGSTIRTLTMGADATTTGPGDVTGIVKRTSFNANTPYSFGNQFTTITFVAGGTYPSQIETKISIGISPAWKTTAINRLYDFVQTGGSGCIATIATHYLDTELNGNIENELVQCTYGTPGPPLGFYEWGKSNSSSTDNWVAIANVGIGYFPASFGQLENTLTISELPSYTWNGSQSTLWATIENWTPTGTPSSASNVIIPDASTTLNSPTLPASTEIKSLKIDAAGVLNSVSGEQLTINGSNNAWSNVGGTFNAGSSSVIFTNAAATLSGTTSFFDVTLNTGSGLTVVPGAELANTSGGTMAIQSGASLTIDAGAVLTVNGTLTNNGTLNLSDGITASAATTIEGDGSYYVGGNWVNNGTFLPGTSTVTFNGAGVQTISGTSLTTFNDLIITGTSAGTTIAAGARVTVSGSTFNANGKLTIDSDAPDNNGSLIYNGPGTPSGNITYNRQMPADALYHYFSSPVSSPLLPETGTLWAWDEPSGTWEDNVTNYASGIGYTAMTNGSLVSFTGSLVADIDIIATSPYYSVYVDGTLSDYNTRWASGRTNYGGGGWNLLGNPFTSAMQIGGEEGFLNANDGDGSLATNRFDPNYVAVYIYDGDSYFYRGKDINFPDPVVNEDPANQMYGFDNIQAGQGFFVLAMQNGVSFHFDRSMQTHETGTTMLKSAATQAAWPGLQLKVKYGEKESSTIIVYNENMTTGLDPGYDVGQLSTGPEVEIYTSMVLKDNSVNFARQALPAAEYDKIIIPVGIDSEKGGTVIFSAFVVPFDNYKFWLEDRTTGTFTDLNVNTYTVSLPAKTYGTGRFFIYASVNTPTGIDSPAVDLSQDIRIWNSDDKVIIKGYVSERAICEVYDLQGQKVMVTNLTDGELNIVDLFSVSRGVYLVRVVDGMKVYTRKIVLL